MREARIRVPLPGTSLRSYTGKGCMMEDPRLNRSIEETRELASRWSQFHDFYTMALKGENINTQAELKFLEVKMRVAMLHGGFMNSIRHDQKVAQNMIDIMASCILLKRLKDMNPNEQQKIEYDWNEAYLLISETLSHLEEEREELAQISARAYKFNQFRKKSADRASRLVRNPFFIVGVVLVILLSVSIGAPVMGYYDIRDIRTDVKFTQKFYNPVMNTLRLAFPRIPYANMGEIAQKNPKFAKVDENTRGSLISGVGEAAFAELTNRGFPREHFQTFISLIGKNRGFQSTVYHTPNGNLLIEHALLFDENEDADLVVEIRRDHMDNQISQERKHNINQNMTLCHRANLLVILELSNPEYREEFAREKWGFRESEIGV